MKVFISWSGEVSQQIAEALKDWLPQVIQVLDEPFVSTQGIEKGASWAATLEKELEACNEGLIVVTADNQQSPWLNFEAGALSKHRDVARVRTVLFGLPKAALGWPLATFQATDLADEADMLQLIKHIATSANFERDSRFIETAFRRNWSELQQALESVRPGASNGPGRSQESMVEEVLETVRELDRRNEVLQDFVRGEMAVLRAEIAKHPRRERAAERSKWQNANVALDHPRYGPGRVVAADPARFEARFLPLQEPDVKILDLAAVPPEVAWAVLSSARSNADT